MKLSDFWCNTVDPGNRQVDEGTFRELERRAGLFKVDLLANNSNASVKTFFLVIASNNALAKDAFFQDWKEFEPCFACQRPRLIGAAL